MFTRFIQAFALVGVAAAQSQAVNLTWQERQNFIDAAYDYDVRNLAFGQNDKENFDTYGIITNEWKNNLTRELSFDNSHPSLVYVLNSTELRNRESAAWQVHVTMVRPVLKDLKGYMLFYAYDCAHPIAKMHHLTKEDPTYNYFMH